MATTSAGSVIFALLSFLAICLVVLLLLRHYLPLRTTPAYLTIPVFLALALPASIVLLVPIDLASHAVAEDGQSRGIYLSDGVLWVVWRITYWLTFVLTWFVLPILGEYADAGYREPKARLIYALRSNAKYQLIALACGVAGLLYIILSSSWKGNSLKGLVMALAYAWGLILAIYLMGHGLVALPRRLFKSASISGRLKTLQTYAPRLHERMTDAIIELDELEGQVAQLRLRKSGTARDFQEWIEELEDTSGLPESRIRQDLRLQTAEAQIPAVITERYLADLTRKLKRARHKRMRFIEEWDYLVQEASDLQTILDATSSKKLDFGKSSNTPQWLDKMSIMTPSFRYQVYANVIPKLRLGFSGIFALASACIIWSEIFKSVVPQISVVGLSIVHHPNSDDGKIGFAGQVMAAGWLSYMCVAALTSIREVKVWGNRALVRRHTYGESACWYACQVAKLTVPLSYNFITFIPKDTYDIYHKSVFYKFLGELINSTLLGSGFSAFFPIFVIVPVLATSFNLYSKVQGYLGFGVIEDEEDADGSSLWGSGGWREGQALIARELQGNAAGGLTSRDRSPLPNSSSNASASRSSPLPNNRPTVQPSSASSAARPLAVGASREERRRLIDSDLPADEASADDGGNVFSQFAHRVQNTFDTAERPEFIRNLSRPKWMGGNNGSENSSGRPDFGNGLGRWFGGRPDDGRVRL